MIYLEEFARSTTIAQSLAETKQNMRTSIRDAADIRETIKDHTPLMRQEDILECMARAVVRGKIDLVCAYYQILMEIVDIHKTVFKTPFGMYE